MFWKELKRVRKRVKGEEMRVKDRDGNMQVEGKAVNHRWAEYFDELVECAGRCAGERCGGG